jgi:uncharacterized C2H2 Zn-finger protein
MLKVCIFCGKEFKTKPSQGQRCCSRSCGYKHRTLNALCVIRCPQCGKLFTTKICRPRASCSRACSHAAKCRKVELTCPVCGKLFKVMRAYRNVSKYCSSACAGRSKRLVKWPTAKQLAVLVLKIKISNIAEMYGVHSTTVRYWCKRLGVVIPHPSSLDTDYRKLARAPRMRVRY